MLNAPPRSNNHPELQHRRQIQTTCPNPGGQSYVKDGSPAPCSQISVETFRRRLAGLDLSPRAPIRDNARTLAAKCGIDPVELLHMAICRAAKPGASRPDIGLVPYLTMVMRSIVSGIAKARRRAADYGVVVPFQFVREQVPSTRSILDPLKMLQRRQEQSYFAGLLDELQGGDPLLVKLVDAIGMNMRGKRIQQELGLGRTELASLRRRLKRKVSHILVREGLNTR